MLTHYPHAHKLHSHKAHKLLINIKVFIMLVFLRNHDTKVMIEINKLAANSSINIFFESMLKSELTENFNGSALVSNTSLYHLQIVTQLVFMLSIISLHSKFCSGSYILAIIGSHILHHRNSIVDTTTYIAIQSLT